MDDTFKCVPSLFAQIYTIHGETARSSRIRSAAQQAGRHVPRYAAATVQLCRPVGRSSETDEK